VLEEAPRPPVTLRQTQLSVTRRLAEFSPVRSRPLRAHHTPRVTGTPSLRYDSRTTNHITEETTRGYILTQIRVPDQGVHHRF